MAPKSVSRAFFVTGTDTDVGKTVVTAGLLTAAAGLGLRTAAVKPVAAGCEATEAGLRNADALQLQAAATMRLDYVQVNPVALAPAIAPHLAAAQAGRRLAVAQLAGLCRGVLMERADLTLIEGAGGWRVPLSDRELMSGLARELGLPVVLVVGMRLGCLNHALLTAEAIMRDGLQLAGWVANRCVPTMPFCDENIATLRHWLPAPCLGEVPFLETPAAEVVAPHLDLAPLLGGSHTG